MTISLPVFGFLIFTHGPPSISSPPNSSRSQLVAPVFERAFGELHDVAFVHQGDGVTIVGDRVFNRGTHQAFGAFFRARLDADAAMFREANFLHAHLIAQEFDHFVCFRRVGFPLDTRVDLF